MTAGAPKLSVVGVRKEFEGRRSVIAIDEISFDLAENEFATLVGTSGCGKSTLLSIIAGLETQTAGEVLIDGSAVEGPGRDRGVVFQTYTIFPWMTVQKNIEFALQGESISRRRKREIATEHLELVGLGQFGDSLPNQLSGGMRQRVAIARALCYRPKVLLMDEPFGALDAQTRIMMQESLLRIWSEFGITVLFVTHDVDEALFLADRVLVMSASPGRIVADLSVPLARPRSSDVATDDQFIQLKRLWLEKIRAGSIRAFEQQNR